MDHPKRGILCVVFAMTGITEIPHGTKITKPGIYDMPMSWYHDDCCEGFSISSTGLRTVVLQSPHHFHANLVDAYPKDGQKQSFAVGTLVHCLVLGDEVFSKRFAVLDLETDFTDFRKNAAKEWRDRQQQDGKYVITKADLVNAQYMAENLAKSPEAMMAMSGGVVEKSLIWRDEETGIWLKSRPDMLPDQGGISDLKTTNDASIIGCQRAVTKYRYDMQMALAFEGVAQLVSPEHAQDAEAYLIFVQTSAPFTVTPIKIDADAIYWARCWIRRALQTVKKCIDSAEWPMPAEGWVEYTLPDSLAHRNQELQASGELPNLGGF